METCSVCKWELELAQPPAGEIQARRCRCGLWVPSRTTSTEWVFSDAHSSHPTLRFVIKK